MEKQRDSGIELLRIIAIFMVIGVHLWGYGGFYESVSSDGIITKFFADILKIFFRSAVNIFIIISGYFMVSSRFDLKKSYKRVLRTYIVIYFYSVTLSIFTLCMGSNFYTVNSVTAPVWKIVLKMLFPVSSQIWYYLTDYILLCLFVPFINLALVKLSKKQYSLLLLISGFVLSIWPILGNIKPINSVIISYGYEGIAQGKNIFSFIFLYMIGGFIALHCKKRNNPKPIYLVLAFSSVFLNYVIFDLFGKSLNTRGSAELYANPFVILTAVFMFLFFKDLHFRSRVINTFASTTIGVYAVSEFVYIRAWLWNILNFKNFYISNSVIRFLTAIGVSVAIFLCCAVIDLIRQYLFKFITTLFQKRFKTKSFDKTT